MVFNSNPDWNAFICQYPRLFFSYYIGFKDIKNVAGLKILHETPIKTLKYHSLSSAKYTKIIEIYTLFIIVIILPAFLIQNRPA